MVPHPAGVARGAYRVRGAAGRPRTRAQNVRAEVRERHVRPQFPAGGQRLLDGRHLVGHLDPWLGAGQQPDDPSAQQRPPGGDEHPQPRSPQLAGLPVGEARANPGAPAGQRVDLDRRAHPAHPLAEIAQPEAVALPPGGGIEPFAVVLHEQCHRLGLVQQAQPDRPCPRVPVEPAPRCPLPCGTSRPPRRRCRSSRRCSRAARCSAAGCARAAGAARTHRPGPRRRRSARRAGGGAVLAAFWPGGPVVGGHRPSESATALSRRCGSRGGCRFRASPCPLAAVKAAAPDPGGVARGASSCRRSPRSWHGPPATLPYLTVQGDAVAAADLAP